ncbi:MAG: hypothetical protein OXI24_03100 [Candidatus Poribacteria bacterium]|nr:hypothetical protein [Candidatus Poribacteria bacterium]
MTSKNRTNDFGSVYEQVTSVAVDDIPNEFGSVSIKIASATEIKNRAKRTACKLRGTERVTWPCSERGKCDCGEVKKAETINYRSLRPEPEGLFCEAIFGPHRDWCCYCGKYKHIKHAGTICEKCHVEVTNSRVRRGRFGYIPLALPVAHIWFSKALPSPLAMVCGLSLPQLERVLYADAFIVIEVTDSACPLEPRDLLTESEYVKHSRKYQGGFRADTCAGAIREILRGVDMQAELDKLKADVLGTNSEQQKRKLNKQIKQIEGFIKSKQHPEAMIIDVISVGPPYLRPFFPVDTDRYAISDLNTLYRRVINRSNRTRELIQLDSPKTILKNEHRLLQEAVDSLFHNQRSPSPVKGDYEKRPLKSLTEGLSGKYGRFQQDRHEKFVDYSGCAVIVPDPGLRPHQCGLPKKLIIKLFEPFIIKKLKDYNYAQTTRRAKVMATQVDSDSPVWEVLEDVIKYRSVLLSSRPTFHRLGIQAFKPTLVEGDAIKVPPLFYKMFKVVGDSDAVTVHVPITKNAQIEARFRLIATRNIRKPANGKPIGLPHPDIGLGLNFLTQTLPQHATDAESLHQAYILQVFEPVHCKPWYRRRYTNIDEVVLAYESGKLQLHDSVQFFFANNQEPLLTTVGRVIFNQILPKGLKWTDEHTNLRAPFFNREVTMSVLTELVNQSLSRFGTDVTASFLGHLQKLGFEYATQSDFSESPAADMRSAAYRDAVEVGDYFRAAVNARNDHVNRMMAIPKATALNRRLVNVASEVIVKEEDCGTRHAVSKFATESNTLASKINGRTAARNIRHPITKEILVDTGTLITPKKATLIEGVNIKEVKVHSVLTCESERGVCAKCYGADLTDGRSVRLGQPVGLVAAQSIAELNMQPLLVYLHVHVDTTPDIITGIPRLIELFEAHRRTKERVPNPHDILKTGNFVINDVCIKGEEAVWTYLIEEIQKVYGAENLDDKHIEVIIRQMSQKIRITEPGDTHFSLNEKIEKQRFHQENQKVYQNGGICANGEPILQGITEAALNTESFLLAASLKQPRKVLTDAAIQGKQDPLSGIRENMMAGKLIPAGTGFKTLR